MEELRIPREKTMPTHNNEAAIAGYAKDKRSNENTLSQAKITAGRRTLKFLTIKSKVCGGAGRAVVSDRI